MKITWICLPLVLALSCCDPIRRDPGSDNPIPKNEVLRAGQFARTMIDNTSFFRQLPLSGAQADLLLQRHTAMRLIQVDPGYSKVELDSGEVGYVLTAMLEAIPRQQPVTPPIVPDSVPPLNPDPNPQPDSGIPSLPPLPPTIDPE